MKRWMVRLIGATASAALAVGAYATRDAWWTEFRRRFADQRPTATAERNDGDHGGHAHGSSDALVLSDQAAKNLGLRTGEVEPRDFWKAIELPATVAEQPNRSERRITSLLHGVVTRVRALPGQTLRPGDRILDLRIAGEGLIAAQSNLLRTLQELPLVDAELRRIAPIVASGGMPERNKIEKEYERKRLESARNVQVQELLVRGLTSAQIDGIVQSQELLRDVAVVVPNAADKDESLSQGLANDAFTVERIDVFPGKFVQPGDSLCDLALHGALIVEGAAFESDSAAIHRAIERQWPVAAIFDPEDGKESIRGGLKILYVDNVVDPATRTVKFIVPLANEVVRDIRGDDGHDYRIWRFKPGQKLRLSVPVAKLEGRFVLPADAVTRDGPECYAFRVNGKQMERVAVHLEHSDETHAVIGNDGSLFPGDTVALNAAYQLNLAIKKASGSGVDPHAGHDHSH